MTPIYFNISHTLAEEHKNIIVIREEDKNSQSTKDIEEAVRSKEFAEVIKSDFQGRELQN
ncbi:MetQ/NlpA family ABC transporter substrate-binding protein [Leptospira ilyithenensis]|uniref:MetQ/NlpA family ABC transporter substrate-binding protein n=1 Tax=Leptospira ilyithenensis TaxID=2484901 RepID=UPI0014384DE6